MRLLFLAIWLLVFSSFSFASSSGDKNFDQFALNSSKIIVSSVAVSQASPSKAGGKRSKDQTILVSTGNGASTVQNTILIPNSDYIYREQQTVAKKFLDPEKRKYISKKAHLLLIEFMKNYTAQKSPPLDITDLSARARIYLLREIVNFKINHLDRYSAEMKGPSFYAMEQNNFWGKENGKFREHSYAIFHDRFPTIFKIGEFEYTLTMSATNKQRGNAFLTGIYSLRSNTGTHDEIYNTLRTYNKYAEHSRLLLQQKKDGKPINTADKNESRFLNGFNLLLDFEVARRLVDIGRPSGYKTTDENFRQLPIITYLKFMVDDLTNCYRLLTLGDGELSDEDRKPVSLVAGNSKRDIAAKNFISRILTGDKEINPEVQGAIKDSLESVAAIRHNLEYLHQSDENSEDEYSMDEAEDVDIFSNGEIATEHEGSEQEYFLRTVSDRYIESMRNADPQRGEVMWGGDIELIQIAMLHNLRITVYQPSYDSLGRVIRRGPGILLINNPPIGPEKGRQIYLLLDGQHYEAFDPSSGSTSNVPADGNCLFHALLRIMNNSSTSTIEEVANLRQEVARSLQNLVDRTRRGELITRDGTAENNLQPITIALNEQDDPIYTRFAAIFLAENADQATNAIYDLPPGRLRDEAVWIRQSTLSAPVSSSSYSSSSSSSGMNYTETLSPPVSDSFHEVFITGLTKMFQEFVIWRNSGSSAIFGSKQ